MQFLFLIRYTLWNLEWMIKVIVDQRDRIIKRLIKEIEDLCCGTPLIICQNAHSFREWSGTSRSQSSTGYYWRHIRSVGLLYPLKWNHFQLSSFILVIWNSVRSNYLTAIEPICRIVNLCACKDSVKICC